MNYPSIQPPTSFSAPPPPAAREAWPELEAQMAKLDAAWAKATEYETEITQLREQLPAAQQRDNRALGEALANGEPEPAPETELIEREMERLHRNCAAMYSAISERVREVEKLITRRQDKWAQDLQPRITDAAARYRTAIVELEHAREHLVAQVTLGAWLTQFPSTGGHVDTSSVPENELTAGPNPKRFGEILDSLRRDSEKLPSAGPVKITGPKMTGNQLIYESIDPDGTKHAAWATTESPLVTQWRAEDREANDREGRIKRLLRTEKP